MPEMKHISLSSSEMLYCWIKRISDILFSLIFLILTSPIWLITAIGIKLSSDGPIIYKAERIGKGGKPFIMYKFRSMYVDRTTNEKSLRPDINRVFRFGSFIRSTKIDELPQMINVLLGQMTVVGPRPAAKDQIDITRSGKYYAIYKIKVGLTSPSALYDYIYGDKISNEKEYNLKVLPTRLDLDLYYLKNRCLVYDLRIVIDTVLCIIFSFFRVQPRRIYHRLVAAVYAHGKTSETAALNNVYE